MPDLFREIFRINAIMSMHGDGFIDSISSKMNYDIDWQRLHSPRHFSPPTNFSNR